MESIVITCHGTCKIEYPARYKIPVISCFGYNNLTNDAEQLPFTAQNSLEYSELIMNKDKLSISKKDIRIAKAKPILLLKPYKELQLRKSHQRI